jgi:hypothetical protein
MKSTDRLPHWFARVGEELVPAIRRLADGRYAIAVAGSIGRGTADERSDLDFRLYCDRRAPSPRFEEGQEILNRCMNEWRKRGVEIDDCWIQSINETEKSLDDWISGVAEPRPMVWTVWGYYLPTDIANQVAVEDPHGVLAAWQRRLHPYPSALKRAVLRHHGSSLRYWISDYHYRNKAERGDLVFLSGLTGRLMHNMIQILFAINEVYYPGDGSNLALLERQPNLPPNFRERATAILYPGEGADGPETQREHLIELAKDVLASAESSDAPA